MQTCLINQFGKVKKKKKKKTDKNVCPRGIMWLLDYRGKVGRRSCNIILTEDVYILKTPEGF